MDNNRQEQTSGQTRTERAPRRSRRYGFRKWGAAKRRGGSCYFCAEGIRHVDYKDPDLLRRFITERGKIRPSRQVGLCAKHQRSLAKAVKRARHLALLPFTADYIHE